MARPVTCPSGLSGVVSGLSGQTAQAMITSPAQHELRRILRSSWKQTQDLGVYASHGDEVDWSRVYYSDRYAVLYACSIDTYGDELTYRWPCKNPEGRRCKPIWDRVKLSSLTRRPMPAATRESLAAGVNRFDAEAAFGPDLTAAPRRFAFKLLDEKDEASALEMIQRQPLTGPLKAQILEIDGVSDNDLGVKRLLEATNLELLMRIREAIDAQDGGIETGRRLFCSECGWDEQIDLPLGKLFSRRLRPPPEEMERLQALE